MYADKDMDAYHMVYIMVYDIYHVYVYIYIICMPIPMPILIIYMHK